MFLITTADERSWKKDEKILFLGEWCKLYSRKLLWSQLNYEVLPYHWNDRTKLYHDFNYTTDVYERYLNALGQALNTLHRTNHSTRYWRIVIGPWLFHFIDILYDRYLSISSATQGYKINTTWIMDSEYGAWVPNDFAKFQQYFITDQWNHFIYGEIIKEIGQISYNVIEEKNLPSNIGKIVTQFQMKKIIRRMLGWYSYIVPDKFNTTVFVSSYFNWRNLTKLQLALKQFPYPCVATIPVPNLPIILDQRDGLKPSRATNGYEKLLEKLIPMQIPKAYVEGYNVLKESALAYFPKRIKAIYTANALYSNEGFKIWAAEQIETGVKLLNGQHGGCYGAILFSGSEEHEVSASDNFYSWGWGNRLGDNIKRMPAVKLIYTKKRIRSNPLGGILWVQLLMPRYAYRIDSAPIASQLLDYIDDQIVFANNLTYPVCDLLRLRLYPADYGWNMETRFKDAGLGKYIDQPNKSFILALKESRLCIATYNATTFLETFAANFPTVIFWNPKHWELRPAAAPYFDELSRVGVLHSTPESAAAKVNKIYADPLAWWLQPEIQAVKNRFCNEFAYTSDNWLQEWKEDLQFVHKYRPS